jgi:hypothetical protein
MLSKLLTFSFLALCTAAAHAQQEVEPTPRDLAGTYTLKQSDGTPPDPSGTYRVHITRLPFTPVPMYVGVFSFDSGSGPVMINDPGMTFTAVQAGTSYAWESNAAGGFLRPKRYGFLQEFTHPPADSNRFEQ